MPTGCCASRSPACFFFMVLALIATYFLIVGNAQPGNAE
jgi:hypothetical protein